MWSYCKINKRLHHHLIKYLTLTMVSSDVVVPSFVRSLSSSFMINELTHVFHVLWDRAAVSGRNTYHPILLQSDSRVRQLAARWLVGGRTLNISRNLRRKRVSKLALFAVLQFYRCLIYNGTLWGSAAASAIYLYIYLYPGLNETFRVAVRLYLFQLCCDPALSCSLCSTLCNKSLHSGFCDNIIGIQFHVSKSHFFVLALLLAAVSWPNQNPSVCLFNI